MGGTEELPQIPGESKESERLIRDRFQKEIDAARNKGREEGR